jgi:hypothetical protein
MVMAAARVDKRTLLLVCCEIVVGGSVWESRGPMVSTLEGAVGCLSGSIKEWRKENLTCVRRRMNGMM